MEAVINAYGLVGKPATFAVKIFDEFGNTHERVVPLTTKSRYQAELAAIKYVCHAIPHKDVELVVKTSITQIPQIFTKTSRGEYPKRKRSNQMIDDVRELVSKFARFSCEIDIDSKTMCEVKEKAKKHSI